jgi:hypothetical protein
MMSVTTHWSLCAYTPRRRRGGSVRAIIVKGDLDYEKAMMAAFGMGMAVLPPADMTAFAWGAYPGELAAELDEIERGERQGYLIPATFMTPQYRAGLRRLALEAQSRKAIRQSLVREAALVE